MLWESGNLEQNVSIKELKAVKMQEHGHNATEEGKKKKNKPMPAGLGFSMGPGISVSTNENKINEGMKESAINSLLTVMKPMIAAPFNEIEENGDEIADAIIKKALNSPLMSELSAWELGALSAAATKAATGFPSDTYTDTFDEIKKVLAFGPEEIVSGAKDLDEVFKLIFNVLKKYGWA